MMTEQEKTDAFVCLVGGVQRADRLMWIWNNSYSQGTEYDRLFYPRRHKTREEVFKLRAKKERFSEDEISAFLVL